MWMWMWMWMWMCSCVHTLLEDLLHVTYTHTPPRCVVTPRLRIPGEYASESLAAPQPKAPRLFQLSDVSGNVKVEEVDNFSQEDLIDEDCMLLDTFNQVFVWVGSRSSEREKRESMQLAEKYIAAATDGRDPDTPVIRVCRRVPHRAVAAVLPVA
jgi:hypothetical protein